MINLTWPQTASTIIVFCLFWICSDYECYWYQNECRQKLTAFKISGVTNTWSYRHFLAQAPRQWAWIQVAASCLLMIFSRSFLKTPQGTSSVARSHTWELEGGSVALSSLLRVSGSTRGLSWVTCTKWQFPQGKWYYKGKSLCCLCMCNICYFFTV